MSYLYNSTIAGYIFKVLEQTNSQAVGISHNQLITQTTDLMRLHKVKKAEKGNRKRGKFRPSRSRIRSTIEQLIKWNLIKTDTERAGRKRKFFTFTEIGKLCSQYDYSPDYYLEIVKVIQLICTLALTGVTKVRQIHVGSRVYDDYGLTIQGVSKYDIISNTDVTIPLKFLRPNFDENQIQGYLDFLIEKKVLRLLSNDGKHLRYSLYDNKKENFIADCWIDLYNNIELRIQIRSNYLFRRIMKEEKDWLVLHQGKEKAEETIWRMYEIRKEKSMLKSDSKLKKHYIEVVKSLDKSIVQIYEKLRNYYENTFDIPGFQDLSISLVCPYYILNLVKK